MKKTLITAIIATPVITLGALIGLSNLQPKEQPVKENVVIEASAEEAEIISNTSVTTPEPTNEAVVEETVTNITPPETTPTEPVNDPMLEIREYISATVPPVHVTTVTNAFYRNQEAFYKDRAGAVAISLEVINDRTIINKLGEIKNRLAQL